MRPGSGRPECVDLGSACAEYTEWTGGRAPAEQRKPSLVRVTRGDGVAVHADGAHMTLLARRLPLLLLSVGALLLLTGVVLGVRPIGVEMVSVDGSGANSSLRCGSHFAPDAMPYGPVGQSGLVRVNDGEFPYMRAGGVERNCADAISRSSLVLVWVALGAGVAAAAAGGVLLARRRSTVAGGHVAG